MIFRSGKACYINAPVRTLFGSGGTRDDIESFEPAFRKRLETLNRIDASIGSIVTTVDSDAKLSALISQADQLMYERKKSKKTSRYLRKKCQLPAVIRREFFLQNDKKTLLILI